MKKRWQQYVRVYKTETESWEEAMDRILTFLGPIWNALCKDEIFLADWMPELKRFLDQKADSHCQFFMTILY